MAGQPARQRIVVPFDGHTIGQGFNSDTGERVGTGLSVASVGADPVAPGQRAAFAFHMVTSQASFEKELNIGAEIDARYGLFSGGGTFGFAEKSAINSVSTYIVASCVVKNALRSGKGFTPNDIAKPFIAKGDPDGFKKAFGDRFTEALHTGGEFYALVRMTSSNVQHQRKISASLHAELNGLAAAVSFKASFEQAQNDTSSQTEVLVEIHQTGGVGKQIKIPGTDADRIREHMNGFAEAADKSAGAYKAELVTYDTLALPFPPLLELEEKRRVLEDCLAQRQLYWSAISSLTFAQSEDGDRIFQDLPPPEELVARENEFRRVLSDLMAHARAVSSGAIPPTLFPKGPPLPRFKRRAASRFADFWAKRNEPDLLQDEKVLITRIGQAASQMLSVPLEEASPETMELAADMIEELRLKPLPDSQLRSVASLPRMIDAPLRRIISRGAELDDLAGLEPFSRLEVLLVEFAKLRDIQAIASTAGLRELYLNGNEIVDLSALGAHASLEVLRVAGNRIRSLDPMRKLHALRILSIAHGDPDFPDNPIADARALADLPRLANSLTSADQLRLKLFNAEGELLRIGLATRIGNTNRFQFTSDGSGKSEPMLVMGLIEWSDLNLFPTPVVLTVVRFPNGGFPNDENAAVGCTRPNDRTASLPAVDLIRLFSEQPGSLFNTGTLDINTLSTDIVPITVVFTGDLEPPSIFLEVEPA